VLKQLVDEGYVIQKAGDNDRRQRLLFVTVKGEALVSHLAGLQTTRIEHALQGMPAEGRIAVLTFLRGMIGRDDPDPVLRMILQASHDPSAAAADAASRKR
jgi:DNA-binding MarR family transcriptional regulator